MLHLETTWCDGSASAEYIYQALFWVLEDSLTDWRVEYQLSIKKRDNIVD